MSKISKVDFLVLNEGLGMAIPTSVPSVKKKWEDNKATDINEAVIFDAAIKGVGICQVSFPYRSNLEEELTEMVPFGTPIDLSSIGTVTGIQVYLYNKALNVRITMEPLI